MQTDVSAEGVKNIIKELGYELEDESGSVFAVRGSSGIKILCAVEREILDITVPLVSVPEAKITRELAMAMLWSDNGLTTSHLELVRGKGTNNVRIILMNYCKLQELGDDDRDDIETALEFIELDTVRARKVLAGLAS